MKKTILFVLSLLLMLSSVNTYAAPKFRKKMPPGIAKKFKDIQNVKWAEKAINKMAEKGYFAGVGNGLFLPKHNVTKTQAVVMALRLTGYKEEAQNRTNEIIKGKRKFKNKKAVQQWAYGYLDLAQEKGILTQEDVENFNGRVPVKRYEMVKYIIRALGYEEEAQNVMNEQLDFTDAKAVPKDYIGYVYLVEKLGIISGYPDHTFQPNRPVSRAQLAVITEKIDYLLENGYNDGYQDSSNQYEIYKKYIGKIDKIKENEIIIKTGKYLKTIKIDSDTIILINDRKVSVTQIKKGDIVAVRVDGHSKAILVVVKDQKHKVNSTSGSVISLRNR